MCGGVWDAGEGVFGKGEGEVHREVFRALIVIPHFFLRFVLVVGF